MQDKTLLPKGDALASLIEKSIESFSACMGDDVRDPDGERKLIRNFLLHNIRPRFEAIHQEYHARLAKDIIQAFLKKADGDRRRHVHDVGTRPHRLEKPYYTGEDLREVWRYAWMLQDCSMKAHEEALKAYLSAFQPRTLPPVPPPEGLPFLLDARVPAWIGEALFSHAYLDREEHIKKSLGARPAYLLRALFAALVTHNMIDAKRAKDFCQFMKEKHGYGGSPRRVSDTVSKEEDSEEGKAYALFLECLAAYRQRDDNTR